MKEEKKYFIYGKDDEEGNIEIKGCIRNGISEHAAEEIYNQMASFAEYAFNKSHAAAYAVIGYQTGYLKTYYPVEFMAALMTSVMGDAGQIAGYIRNCTEMGIDVLPPGYKRKRSKISQSHDGKISFGFSGKECGGKGSFEAIVKARKEKGVPKDINEFIENLDVHQINKKSHRKPHKSRCHGYSLPKIVQRLMAT
jgi:DNA polymerase-3 subunit alpha